MSSSSDRQNLEFLNIQTVTLQQMGIHLNPSKRRELLQNYWKFFILICCTIYLEYGLISFAVHSVSNLDVVTRSLSMFNQGCLILVKIITFLVKGDKFMLLICEMNQLAEKANSMESKKWFEENRISQLIAKMYLYSCWITAGCAGIVPLIQMSHDYHKIKEINKKLPFVVYFPFDDGGWLIFVLNYILSLVYMYSLINMSVGVDTLYGWYIYNVSAHFRILRCKVAAVALKLETLSDYNKYTQDIHSLALYHNKVLKFAEDFNDIFSGILWFEVMLSCLQMCFVMYTLNNDKDVSNMPFNFMILVAVSIQLMIYCFGGEKIKNESFMLSYDIYLVFPWHKMTPQQKKLMLLPLMRSQKLSVLKGLFFEVDCNLLVYIVKTAFSFNALLSAMKE